MPVKEVADAVVYLSSLSLEANILNMVRRFPSLLSTSKLMLWSPADDHGDENAIRRTRLTAFAAESRHPLLPPSFPMNPFFCILGRRPCYYAERALSGSRKKAKEKGKLKTVDLVCSYVLRRRRRSHGRVSLRSFSSCGAKETASTNLSAPPLSPSPTSRPSFLPPAPASSGPDRKLCIVRLCLPLVLSASALVSSRFPSLPLISTNKVSQQPAQRRGEGARRSR